MVVKDSHSTSSQRKQDRRWERRSPEALVLLARLLARHTAREALVGSDRCEGEQDDG